jgi:hypothetical protein
MADAPVPAGGGGRPADPDSAIGGVASADTPAVDQQPQTQISIPAKAQTSGDAETKQRCWPAQAAALRPKLSKRRKPSFHGMETGGSGMRRLVQEAVPWVLLLVGIAMAIIIIALQSRGEPAYPSTSSPPLPMTCLQVWILAAINGPIAWRTLCGTN